MQGVFIPSSCNLMCVARVLFKYRAERNCSFVNVNERGFLQQYFFYWKLTIWHDPIRLTSQLYNAMLFIFLYIVFIWWHCTKNSEKNRIVIEIQTKLNNEEKFLLQTISYVVFFKKFYLASVNQCVIFQR